MRDMVFRKNDRRVNNGQRRDRNSGSIVEKVAADFGGGRVVVGFPINIRADVGDGRGGGFLGEFDGSGGLLGGGFVDLGGMFLGENSFPDQAPAKNRNGIVVLFVVFNLLRRAVFFVVRVGDAVPIIAVGVNFQNGGFAQFFGPFHGDLGFRPYFVNVRTIDHVPLDGVGFGTLGEATAVRGGT